MLHTELLFKTEIIRYLSRSKQHAFLVLVVTYPLLCCVAAMAKPQVQETHIHGTKCIYILNNNDIIIFILLPLSRILDPMRHSAVAGGLLIISFYVRYDFSSAVSDWLLIDKSEKPKQRQNCFMLLLCRHFLVIFFFFTFFQSLHAANLREC